jgi:hypothetical protein
VSSINLRTHKFLYLDLLGETLIQLVIVFGVAVAWLSLERSLGEMVMYLILLCSMST